MPERKQASPNAALRNLPSVDEVVAHPAVRAEGANHPHDVVVDAVRTEIDAVRRAVLDGKIAPEEMTNEAIALEAIAAHAAMRLHAFETPSLRRVINATGVILHTNLGRSPLAQSAIEAVDQAARGYSTLEYNTDAMARGSRHDHCEHLLTMLTGAEAAMAVNNNAAAVMMVLSEFASGHEAVVSRGELVEIGGSFRIPDIMSQSNARMVEVGTTNKTHLFDYERAVTPDTAMFLKVHTSNYRLVGFTESVAAKEMKKLAEGLNPAREAAGQPRIMVYEDLGSGCLVRLSRFGAQAEPTVGEALSQGCDLVSFSGDKLLGGPQAGIIIGSKKLIDRLKKNPLARAMRLDKMTLAALEATLRLYLDPERAAREVPVLRMLNETEKDLRPRAEALEAAVREALGDAAEVAVIPEISRAGGGSLPMHDIPTLAVQVAPAHASAQAVEEQLIRRNDPPVVGRIKHETLVFDVRTVAIEEIPEIASALSRAFKEATKEATATALAASKEARA